MSIGALIVAAGKSSRMGDFKPMMQLGTISIAQRVVHNFRQAGIHKIVMVTGYHSDVLEHHLAANNIVFLRNEQYATTQMFDSVKIGLEYLRDKVDIVLFSPVDVPLFTADTVHRMLDLDMPLVTPYFQGKPGHPILIRSDLVRKILDYTGNRGLKGAMEQCGCPVTCLDVQDPGTIHDADTPEDYAELLRIHNQSLIRSEVRVSLAKEKPFFDEQMYAMLTMIQETGSVRDACERMHISYSTGWNRIRTLESQLQTPLLERRQGGSRGSHSQLTPYGEEIIRRYALLSSKLRDISDELFTECFGGFFHGQP